MVSDNYRNDKALIDYYKLLDHHEDKLENFEIFYNKREREAASMSVYALVRAFKNNTDHNTWIRHFTILGRWVEKLNNYEPLSSLEWRVVEGICGQAPNEAKEERERLIDAARIAYRNMECHSYGHYISYIGWLEENCKYDDYRDRFSYLQHRVEKELEEKYVEAIQNLRANGTIATEEHDSIEEPYEAMRYRYGREEV